MAPGLETCILLFWTSAIFTNISLTRSCELQQNTQIVPSHCSVHIAQCIERLAEWLGRGRSVTHFLCNGTVIAGCSGATSLARLLLLACLRRAAHANPSAGLRSAIGDAPRHAAGGAGTVRRELVSAYTVIVADLKNKGLPIALNRLGHLSSSTPLAEQVLEDCNLPPE
eukprot:8316667-Pyramimonas_sp.AAC.1